jgi:hypothetical protein
MWKFIRDQKICMVQKGALLDPTIPIGSTEWFDSTTNNFMNFINLHILTFGHCMYCIWALYLQLRMWNFILHNYNDQVKSWLIRHRERSPIAIGWGALFALLCFIYFISTMTMFFVFLSLAHAQMTFEMCFYLICMWNLCLDHFLCEFDFYTQ